MPKNLAVVMALVKKVTKDQMVEDMDSEVGMVVVVAAVVVAEAAVGLVVLVMVVEAEDTREDIVVQDVWEVLVVVQEDQVVDMVEVVDRGQEDGAMVLVQEG